MSTFTTKRHDTRTALKATLKDGAGVAVDLAGATVKFLMYSVAGLEVVNREVTVHDAAGGEVWVVFEATEIDTAGVYRGEFEATYSDGTKETFPNSGYITVVIEPDLG